jgi:hypothetical protein
MAAVLSQEKDEAAVVHTILTGYTSRMKPPGILCADLDNMCAYARNIPHSDISNVSDLALRTSLHAGAAQVTSRSSPGRAPLVCCYCNNPGDTRRDCRSRSFTRLTSVLQGHNSAP